MSGSWQGSDRRRRLPADWRRRRALVIARDGGRCVLCAAPGTDVDHVVRGDDHRLENLRLLCRRCHAAKTAGEGADGRRSRTAAARREPEVNPIYGRLN